MNSIKSIARLNEVELENCTPSNASWHTDYRDTAYIHIGGLPLDLSEGDVLLIFSQYGNPVHVNLVRDKDTGKSRGFAFLKYEDQRSCDLAVDNLSGAQVLGRVLSVDHARYRMKEGEVETVGEVEDDTDREGQSRGGKRRKESSESESDEDRPVIKEELELQKLLREHDDDDPMKEYLVREKRQEVEDALKAVTISKENKDEKKHRHKHKHRHHRSRRDGSEEGDDFRENGENGSGARRRQRRDDSERNEGERDVKSKRRRSISSDRDRDYPQRRRTKKSEKHTNGHRAERKHRRDESDSATDHEKTRRRKEND